MYNIKTNKMYIINIKYMKFFKVILEKNSYVPYNHKKF